MKLSKSDLILIGELSKKYNIDKSEIIKIISSPYEFIKSKTSKLSLKSKELDKGEFESIKTNFNIPCIGKLHASYYSYKRISESKKK